MRWRIYYEAGEFDDHDGIPEQAPAFGVICIVQPDETVGRIIVQKKDFYWYNLEVEQWEGGDLIGLLDRWLNNLPTTAVKAGRFIPIARFRDILDRADKDKDFPPTSGRFN